MIASIFQGVMMSSNFFVPPIAVKRFQVYLAPYFSFLRVCMKAGKVVLQVDPDDMFTYMGYIRRELRMSFNTSSAVRPSFLCCHSVPSVHPPPFSILTLVFFNIQCFAAISSWAKIRPDVIAGVGSPEA